LKIVAYSKSAVFVNKPDDSPLAAIQNPLKPMTEVYFKRAEYDYTVLKPIVFEMIEAIAGDRIHPKSRVLVKPNFLSPAKPEKAILTHPLVVRAAVEYVLGKGGRPQVADSPAMGSFERILKDGGFKDALKDLDVEFKPFKTTLKVDIGEPFGLIDIARSAVESDVVINLAKLKTHTQMRLTLGVKNLFGCIIGFKKPEWHMRSGVDRNMFARLLVQIYQVVNPAVTLVDGILALEGQGPGRRGKPRHIGMLIGSCSGPSADMAICQMLGIDPNTLPTLHAAKELSVLDGDLKIIGDFAEVSNYSLPELGPLTFGPKFMQKYMRKHLIQRPVVEPEICKMCSECWKICPAGAITPYEEIIGFDYDRCIRCYCCIEVCPHGALQAVETLPGRLVRKLTKLDH
jgi:uncharacterized protein (DUF362 family)/Pyruvate/2-oxoacid:ferredoxin oxidoreductase delta subunit